jgi:hypothetical protein
MGNGNMDHAFDGNQNINNNNMMIGSIDGSSISSILPSIPSSSIILPSSSSSSHQQPSLMMGTTGNPMSGKEFSINLHPTAAAFSQSLRDLVMFLNWTDVAVIYERDADLIALQDLIKPPTLPKNVQFIFRKSDSNFFRDTLIDVKSRNIYSMIVDIKSDSIPAFLTAVSEHIHFFLWYPLLVSLPFPCPHQAAIPDTRVLQGHVYRTSENSPN